MFRFSFKTACAGAGAIALISGVVQAQDVKLGSLTISNPWVRPTPPGAPTAAGYLTITNHGRAPDRLLGGLSSLAANIEVHQMSMTGGIMRMRPIAGGLLIAPGQSVMLTAGGDRHLMLISPKQPLKSGDHIPATLRFEKAGTVKVTFVVHEAGAGMTPGMKMQ